MGFISKSIFGDILSLILENHFPDIAQLSDPQNEALFGILNREDVFAILPTGHGKSFIFRCLPDLCRKLLLRGRVSLSKECHCGSRLPVMSLV